MRFLNKQITYQINDEYANPYKTWQELGSPEDPSTDQIKAIQAKEDPVLILNDEIKVKEDFQVTDLYETAGVTLTMLVKKPKNRPTMVQDLKYNTYQGLNGEKMVMLNWDHSEDQYIKSFDVYFSDTAAGQFQKINSYDVFDLGFLDFDGREGYYKVRAKDFWDRESDFSETIEVK